MHCDSDLATARTQSEVCLTQAEEDQLPKKENTQNQASFKGGLNIYLPGALLMGGLF